MQKSKFCGKTRRCLNLAEITGKCVNYAEIEGTFINFVEIRWICNMDHWLMGDGRPWFYHSSFCRNWTTRRSFPIHHCSETNLPITIKTHSTHCWPYKSCTCS